MSGLNSKLHARGRGIEKEAAP